MPGRSRKIPGHGPRLKLCFGKMSVRILAAAKLQTAATALCSVVGNVGSDVGNGMAVADWAVHRPLLAKQHCG